MMYPTVQSYSKAQDVAQILCHILVDEMKLQYPQRFLLTEHGPFVWLLAVMDDLHLGGSMAKYIQDGTMHRLSTALDGLPVYLSNHSGLRYAVLLSDKPTLPAAVDIPADDALLRHDVMSLGAGLAGPVSAHAKQLVNMIAVGAQDSGKSMFLRALAHTARMHGSELYLADPVENTFKPQLWNMVSAYPVVRNTGQFLTMLEKLNEEIARRSKAFNSVTNRLVPPEDIDEYNQLTGETMPRVWMIADEANSFLASKAVQDKLGEPARIGRKFGVHLVLAGHDWHENTVNRGLTGYFETRLCLRTTNDTMGKIVLDDYKRGKRTMSFRQPGRAIMRLRGQYQDLQLYYVSPEREESWFSKVEPSVAKMEWMKEQEVVSGQPTVDGYPDVERVLRLQAEGMSPTSIVYQIWGKSGSSFAERMAKVREILATAATATASKSLVLPLHGAVEPQQ